MDGSREATGAPINRSGPSATCCAFVSIGGSGDGDQSELELELPGEFVNLFIVYVMDIKICDNVKMLTAYIFTFLNKSEVAFDRTALSALTAVPRMYSHEFPADTTNTILAGHRATQLFRLQSVYVVY